MVRVGPGKRLPNGMNPTLFLRDGKAVLGSSATGGGLHYKTLQVLANILDFDMDPQAAVDTASGLTCVSRSPSTHFPHLSVSANIRNLCRSRP